MNTKTIVAIANGTVITMAAAIVGLSIYQHRLEKKANAQLARVHEMMAPKQTCCNAPYVHDTKFCWK